jgi:hypothetical protein
MTSETPECVAVREFIGSFDPQFLRWAGGRTVQDCKGSPLGFNSLVMLATNGPPPTSVPSTSTTSQPLQCSFSLSAASVSIEQTGGQRTVGLTTGPACAWTVQNFVSWIKVQPPGGQGSATISITAEPNPGPPRSATIVIGGIPFVVNQVVLTTTTTTTSSSTTTSIPLFADLLPVTPTGNYCRVAFPSGVPTLLVDIRNQGNASAPGSFTRVFFDNGVSGARQVDRVTPALAASTTASDLAFPIPDSCYYEPCSGVTTCTILIAADANNNVPESNEVNNSVTTSCTFDFGSNLQQALKRNQ